MPAASSSFTGARGQVVANKARPLAISLPERSPLSPDVPTLASKPLTLEQCVQQDREERSKWGEYVKIARIVPQ